MASAKINHLADVRHAWARAQRVAPKMIDVTTGKPFPKLPNKPTKE